MEGREKEESKRERRRSGGEESRTWKGRRVRRVRE